MSAVRGSASLAAHALVAGALLACDGGSASPAADGGAATDGATPQDSGASDTGTDASPQDASSLGDGAANDAGHDAGPNSSASTYAYVGGWDWSAAPYPFRAFAVDAKRFALDEIGSGVDVGLNPSYACASRDGRTLYVTNEWDGEEGGVTIASIDGLTGALTRRDHVLAAAAGYVFSSLDPAGKYLLAASYNGGYVASYPVRADGTLGAFTSQVAFGAGAQTHSVRVHPAGGFAFAPNKALNSIGELSFDAASGALAKHGSGETTSAGGPRHVAFSPDGSLLFVVHEDGSALASFAVSAAGHLEARDRKSTLPSDFSGESKGAHVLVHPDKDVVYASNRGHDSLAVFAYDATGHLSLLEHEPSRGQTPWDFDVSRDGQLLAVANKGPDGESGGTLALFSVDADGRLTPQGEPVEGVKEPTTIVLVTR